MIISATIENLYYYRQSPVLSKIDVTFDSPKLYMLYGPNGSGKTTLIKAIANIHVGFDGVIKLEYKEISNWAPEEIAMYISYVPQLLPTIFSYTVREIITMGHKAFLKPIKTSRVFI